MNSLRAGFARAAFSTYACLLSNSLMTFWAATGTPARSEDGGSAMFIQVVVVLGGDDAADHHDIFAIQQKGSGLSFFH
uniref:Secreted protein n=1 Tax=Candidatus Kentrum sp. FW TaxID=2126338 RepID=A0A450U4I9_9GAMM|nr:MAG: hypothetical protein BECKFW1821C_GA0114237_12031 [Candidatus Kentron sp. FW]